jgi:hypothetical protein
MISKKNGEVLLVGAQLSANEELRKELGARSYEIPPRSMGRRALRRLRGMNLTS